MKTNIPRPGAFRPSPKSPIRHPVKPEIAVKINSWKTIGPFPVVGVAHKIAAAKNPGLISPREPNVFNWV